jgi:hypothetical protein
MFDYRRLDIFTVDPVEIIRKKNSTKNGLGAVLTICIPIVIIFFVTYLFITNEARPDIVTETIHHTKDLQSPINLRVEWNTSLVVNETIADIFMITSANKKTSCHLNKKENTMDTLQMCDYGVDGIGENNGVGFAFDLNIEDGWKFFLNLQDTHAPFYINPTNDIVYAIKYLEKKLCQVKFSNLEYGLLSKTSCWHYETFDSDNFFVFEEEGTTWLTIFDRTLTYVFRNDSLHDTLDYKDHPGLTNYFLWKNNTEYFVYGAHIEIKQNKTLIFSQKNFVIKGDFVDDVTGRMDVCRWRFHNGLFISQNRSTDASHTIFFDTVVIWDPLRNFTWSKISPDKFSIPLVVGNHLFLLDGVGTDLVRVDLANFSSIQSSVSASTGPDWYPGGMIYHTMSNALAVRYKKWDDSEDVLLFIDENLEIDIFPNFLNVTNSDLSIMNFKKTGPRKYLFFSIYSHYPAEPNNFETMHYLTNIFECEIIGQGHSCSTNFTTFPQSKIQEDHSGFDDWLVARVHGPNDTFFDVKVKDVIPQWNTQTRTIFTSVMTLTYNDRKIASSNSTNKKMLWSASLNDTELSVAYNYVFQTDIWVHENSQSGMDSKFTCYWEWEPESPAILEHAKYCKMQAVNGIPFPLERTSVFYFNKTFQTYLTNANRAKGTILFNLEPTYKMTQKSSTKNDRLTIMMTIVGIISPLIAIFRLLKRCSYRQENKAEINRQDGIEMSNIEGTMQTEI